MTQQRIRLSFKDIVSSEAYQTQASSWCKNQIFIALAVALATTWFGGATLGLHWIWVVPSILFGVSFLIAFPTMAVNVWLAAIQSGHMEFAPPAPPTPVDSVGRILNMAKSFWSLLSLVFAGFASFHLVRAIGT